MEQGSNKNLTVLPGLNVQWPWSQLILSGRKVVETRNYPLPSKYLNTKMALIETPGPHGRKSAGISSARVIGIVVFGECFRYHSKNEWLKDEDRHLVSDQDLDFGFIKGTQKWGWTITTIVPYSHELTKDQRRGIKFTSSICLGKSIVL